MAVLGDTKASRKKVVRSESRPEGVLNMTTEGGQIFPQVNRVDQHPGEETAERITVLTKGVGKLQPMLKGVRKSLEVLEKQNALPAPLPKRIEDRQVRRASYTHAVQGLAKWDDIVFVSQQNPHQL